MREDMLNQIMFGPGQPPIFREAKLLGCFIDNRFTFKAHISLITQRMESVAFKLRKLAGTRAGLSPFELYNIFQGYIFPRGDYASCIWIFRVFLPFRRGFYKTPQHHDRVFHISLKPMHGYGKRWRVLNNFYMDCMRRIIGAHKSASHVGVLVRMGVLPLQYEFVYRAILWYLKIYNGESDPALTEQLNLFRSDDETFSLTCFYRHSHAYIEHLSNVGGGLIFLILSLVRERRRSRMQCSQSLPFIGSR